MINIFGFISRMLKKSAWANVPPKISSSLYQVMYDGNGSCRYFKDNVECTDETFSVRKGTNK